MRAIGHRGFVVRVPRNDHATQTKGNTGQVIFTENDFGPNCAPLQSKLKHLQHCILLKNLCFRWNSLQNSAKYVVC